MLVAPPQRNNNHVPGVDRHVFTLRPGAAAKDADSSSSRPCVSMSIAGAILLVCGSFDGSFDGSVGRSVGQSVSRLVGRSCCQSPGRSNGWVFGQPRPFLSVCRSINQSANRSFSVGRSVCRSVSRLGYRSARRLVSPSSSRSIDRSVFCQLLSVSRPGFQSVRQFGG